MIFTSVRTGADEDGYARAAEAMDALAATQPGYRGVVGARGADGFGITVSYWADEASAIAWRANPDHVAVREQGRARWYSSYEIVVATATRGYDWSRD